MFSIDLQILEVALDELVSCIGVNRDVVEITETYGRGHGLATLVPRET